MSDVHRQVMLRDEQVGNEWRALWAYLDDDGNLHIDGQDLGKSLEQFVGEDEYEWFNTIRASDIPALIAVLGGTPDEPILTLLQRAWSGLNSARLETTIRESGIPYTFHSV